MAGKSFTLKKSLLFNLLFFRPLPVFTLSASISMSKTPLLTSVDENFMLAFHLSKGTFDGNRRLDSKFDGAFYGRDFIDRNLCAVCRRQRAKCNQTQNGH